MEKNLFSISATELGKESKIPIRVLGEAGEVFYEMALEMITEIQKNNEKGKSTVFICPVGPVGQYPIFVRLVNAHKISLKNVYFINMDEYLDHEKQWISIDHPLSFRGFMKKNVYDQIDSNLVMSEDHRIFPEPGKEKEIEALITRLGGVDICFGGIGINGHMAFNEPPEPSENVTDEEFKNRPTRILSISRETRTINASGALGGAIAAMPTCCITIGMKEILSARKLRLYCFRDWHRAVVRQAAYGEVTSAFPVSFAQQHPDAEIIITQNVAQVPY